MLGNTVRNAGDRCLSTVLSALARAGLRPVLCNACEVLIAIATGIALYLHMLPVAIGLFLLHGLFDFLDGAMRRKDAPLAAGDPNRAERNHAIADKLSEIAILLGIAVGHYTMWWLVVAAIIASIAATCVGFVMSHMANTPRSLALFDRTDRMLVLLIFLAVHSPWLLGLIILMNCATILQRLVISGIRTAVAPTNVSAGPAPMSNQTEPLPTTDRSAVAGFVFSAAALIALPLGLAMALGIMTYAHRDELSAILIAAMLVLTGGATIALAVRSIILTSRAVRGRLSAERFGWALAAVLCYVLPASGLLIWLMTAFIFNPVVKSPCEWVWILLLAAAAAILWPAFVITRRGLNDTLLPPLTFPLAGIGICLGLLGLLASAPAYSVQRSCGPAVYCFDGQDFLLDCEPYAGAVFERRVNHTRLRHMVPVAGNYRLKMANELNETQYTDVLKLLVVDHLPATAVLPDSAGNLHTIASPVRPVVAMESPAIDILDRIGADNGCHWESDPAAENVAAAFGRRTELTLEFPKPKDARQAKLVMDVSNTPNASSNSAGFLKLFGACYPLMSAIRSTARNGYIRFDIQVESGDRWTTRGVVRGASPHLPREEILVLDVSDVPGDRLCLRFPLVAGYWRIGNVRVDYTDDLPIFIREVVPTEAVDQQDQDIADLLRADDHTYYVAEKGDQATITFPERPQVPGAARSLILKACGYYTIRPW